MANINNPWVGYLQRSYEQIKASLLNRLTTSNPEITDHSEGNILIVILGMFAGLIEHLNYYVDNMAREAFVATARFFSSMVKLVRILDYRIKAKFPATVTMTMRFRDSGGVTVLATGPALIPQNTVILTNDGVEFRTTADIVISAGMAGTTFGASQFSAGAPTILGTTTSAPLQEYIIGSDYVHQSIAITINAIIWEEQDTLGFSGPTDRHFIVDINELGQAYIKFGDGVFGQIPPTGFPINASWYTSLGAAGNLVSEATITSWQTAPVVPGVFTVQISNNLKPTGGSDYESIESIRFRAPLSIRTLYRAVSLQDYIDIAHLAPGVDKAAVQFCCNDGDCIKVYIAPLGGGIAQLPLLQSTELYINERKMIMDQICTKPAGVTPVPLSIVVNASVGTNPVLLATTILAALVENFGYEASSINRKIYFSELYTVLGVISGVDNAQITWITTRPYARPYNHINQLVWDRITMPNSTSTQEWKIQYQGSNTFAVWRAQVFQGWATLGVPFTDLGNTLEFVINLGVYATGDTWDFKTYAYNQNILISDYSIPVIDPNDLTLSINDSLFNECPTSCCNP
jgi:hypothetical protein